MPPHRTHLHRRTRRPRPNRRPSRRPTRRPTGGPRVRQIEYARLLKGQGASLGQIAAKTGIPETSLHRYLAVQ
ncbi:MULTISPECIES: helix-turn-helix domain-containing protein [Streptomyces]|uniref:helix-turn-helix domain-containing protein n=1 Tax=Streptomyces TaxID=1883 RepID=UPI003527F0DC